jgi:hypothetical protein
MSIASILRSGIETIKGVTASVQGTVTVNRWGTEDQKGVVTPGSTETFPAIIEIGAQDRPGPAGQINRAYASVLFLEEIDALNTKDVIILPDGTTGPIIEISSPYDGETGKGFITQVWLGALSRTSQS